MNNLLGQTFGRLTVVSQTDRRVARAIVWKCQCECGNTTEVQSRALLSGNTKSCGCWNQDHAKIENGEASKNRLFSRYRKGATHRGKEFLLTRDEFILITSQNCFYCGEPPSLVMKENRRAFNGEYLYNGIDRVDNSKGYEAGNVVPCCSKCNYAKRDMGFQEFMDWIVRLHDGITVRDIRRALSGNPLSNISLQKG